MKVWRTTSFSTMCLVSSSWSSEDSMVKVPGTLASQAWQTSPEHTGHKAQHPWNTLRKKNNRGQTRAAEGKGDKNPGNCSQSLFKGLRKCNFVTDLNSIQNTCFQIWVDASTHPLCSQDAKSSPCTAHQYTLSKIQLMGSLKCLC